MAANFQLVMHSGPTPGKVFPLDGDVITIGRDAENIIMINDAEVSRKHTQFVFQGGKFIVTDMGSTNGTFINGQRLTGQHILQPGEIISLGEQINLLFESVAQVDPNATMLSSGRPPVVAAVARPAQVPTPAPRPSAQPAAGYAGQVPSNPVADAPQKASNMRTILIVIAVIVLCLVCSCIGVLWYIDSNSLWCQYFPFLFSAGCGG
jgi:pSer/pThr/pTyr-binding forkhead associated (FHA) protein